MRARRNADDVSSAAGSRWSDDPGGDTAAVDGGGHRRRRSEMGDDEDSPSRQRRKPPQPPLKSPIQQQQKQQQGQIKQQEPKQQKQYEQQPRSPLRAVKADVVAEMDAEKSKKLLEWELSRLQANDLRSHAWFHGYRVDRNEAEQLLRRCVVLEHGIIDTTTMSTALNDIVPGDGERELKKGTEDDSEGLEEVSSDDNNSLNEFQDGIIDENGMTEPSRATSTFMAASLPMRQRCRMDGAPPGKKPSISGDRRRRNFYCFLVRNSKNLRPPGRYVLSCLRVDNFYDDDNRNLESGDDAMDEKKRKKLLRQKFQRSVHRQQQYPVLHFVINEIILQPGTVYERSQFTFGDTLPTVAPMATVNSAMMNNNNVGVNGQCTYQPGFDSVPDLIRYYVGGADDNAFLSYGRCADEMGLDSTMFAQLTHTEVRIRYPCNRNHPLMMDYYGREDTNGQDGKDYTRLVREHSQNLAAVSIVNELLRVPPDNLIEKASEIMASLVQHQRSSPPPSSHARRRQNSPSTLPPKSDKTHVSSSVQSPTLIIPSATVTSATISSFKPFSSIESETQNFAHSSTLPSQSKSPLSLSTSLPGPSGSFYRPSTLLPDPSTSSLDQRFENLPELSNQCPSTSGLSTSTSHSSSSSCLNPLLNEALNLKSYESSSSFSDSNFALSESIFDAIPSTSSKSTKCKPEVSKKSVSGVIDMDAEIAAALNASENENNLFNVNTFREFEEPKPIVVRSSFAQADVYNPCRSRTESRQNILKSHQSRSRSPRDRSGSNLNNSECFRDPGFKYSVKSTSAVSSDVHVNKPHSQEQQLCPSLSMVVPLITSTLLSEEVIANEQKSIVFKPQKPDIRVHEHLEHEIQKQENHRINSQEILEAENIKNSESVVKGNETLIQENQSQKGVKNIKVNSQKGAEEKQLHEQYADSKLKRERHNCEMDLNHDSNVMNPSLELYSHIDHDVSDILNDQRINTNTMSHRLVGSLEQLRQMRCERLHQTQMRTSVSNSRKHLQSQLVDCTIKNNVTEKSNILRVIEAPPKTNVSMEYSPSSITFQENVVSEDALIRNNGEGTLTKNSDDAEPNTYTLIADHKSPVGGEYSHSGEYQPPTAREQSPAGVFKMSMGECYSPAVEFESPTTKQQSPTVSQQSLIIDRQLAMKKPKSLEEKSQLQTERLKSIPRELPYSILDFPSPTVELCFPIGNDVLIVKNGLQNGGKNREYSSLEVKENPTTMNEEHLSKCIIQTPVGRTLCPVTAETSGGIFKCRAGTYDPNKENCTAGPEKLGKRAPGKMFANQANPDSEIKTSSIYHRQVMNGNNDNKECCDLCGNGHLARNHQNTINNNSMCGNNIISTVNYENTNSPEDYENIFVEREKKYCQKSRQPSICSANGRITSIAYALRSIHLTIIGDLEDSGDTVSLAGTARLAAALCRADGLVTVLPYRQCHTENDKEIPGESILGMCPLQLLGQAGPEGRRARLDVIERFACLQYLVAITVIVTPCLVLIGDDISDSVKVANANQNWSLEDEYEYQRRRFYYGCAGAGGTHLLGEDSNYNDGEDNYDLPADDGHSFGYLPVSEEEWALEKFHWLEALTRLRAAALDKWIRTAADVKQAVGDVYGYRALMSALCSDRIQSLRDVWASLRQLHTTTAVTFESQLRPEFLGRRDKNLNDEAVHDMTNEGNCNDTDVLLQLPPNATIPDVTIVAVLYEQMYNDDAQDSDSDATITALSNDNIRKEGKNPKSWSLITSPLLLLPSPCFSSDSGGKISAANVLGIHDVHIICVQYTRWVKQGSNNSESTTSSTKPPMLQLDRFRSNFRALLNQYGFGDNEGDNNYNDDFIHDDYQSESDFSFRDKFNHWPQESFPYERFYEDQMEQYGNSGVGDYDDCYDDDEDDDGTVICSSNRSSIATVSNTDRGQIKVEEVQKRITTEDSHNRRARNCEEDRYCRWIKTASTSRPSPAPLDIVFRTELHARLFWPPTLHLLDSSNIDGDIDCQKIVPAYALGTTYAALAAINCSKEGKEHTYRTRSSSTLNEVINTQLDRATQDMRLRYMAMEEFLDGACAYSTSVAKSVYANHMEAGK